MLFLVQKEGDIVNERIKALRQALGLTQQVFADKAGTSRANIAGYETKKSVPSDAVISLICEKFNVNENWLRTGAGEMFLPITRDDEIAKLTTDLFKEEEDSFKTRLILTLSKLDASEWAVLEKIAKELTKDPKKKD